MNPVGTRTSSPLGRSREGLDSFDQNSPDPLEVETNPGSIGAPQFGQGLGDMRTSGDALSTSISALRQL